MRIRAVNSFLRMKKKMKDTIFMMLDIEATLIKSNHLRKKTKN